MKRFEIITEADARVAETGDTEALREGGRRLSGVARTAFGEVRAGRSELEVALAIEAAKGLGEQGRKVRVGSMPWTNVFDTQSQQYRDSVLPPGVPRVAIEAGVRDTWWRYVGSRGAVIGMDTFGASAPAKQLFAHFGFTRDRMISTVEELLTRR